MSCSKASQGHHNLAKLRRKCLDVKLSVKIASQVRKSVFDCTIFRYFVPIEIMEVRKFSRFYDVRFYGDFHSQL